MLNAKNERIKLSSKHRKNIAFGFDPMVTEQIHISATKQMGYLVL